MGFHSHGGTLRSLLVYLWEHPIQILTMTGGTPSLWNPLLNLYLVGGLEHVLFSHILGISSSQLTNIFQRGWNHQPDIVCSCFLNCVFGVADWRLIHDLPRPPIIRCHAISRVDAFRIRGIRNWPNCSAFWVLMFRLRKKQHKTYHTLKLQLISVTTGAHQWFIPILPSIILQWSWINHDFLYFLIDHVKQRWVRP